MDKTILNSLDIYYKRLSKVGYVNYNDVYKLLSLIILDELSENCSITEEDLNDINKGIQCLLGSTCLIPFKDYNRTALLGVCNK